MTVFRDRSVSVSWACVIACLLTVFVSGCSTPPRAVYSSRSSELSTIKRWRLDWDQHLSYLGKPLSLPSAMSQETSGRANEFASSYAEAVQKRLADHAGLKFYDNPPSEGTIHLTLYGRVRFSQENTSGDVSHFEPPSGIPDKYGRKAVRGSTTPVRTDFRDLVDSVVVTVFNAADKVLGQVKLTGAEAAGDVRASGVTSREVSDAIKVLLFDKSSSRSLNDAIGGFRK
jgi:hypothetical protein